MMEQRFKDTRTGEIVTSIPIFEIVHYEKYNGHLQAGDFECKDLVDEVQS